MKNETTVTKERYRRVPVVRPGQKPWGTWEGETSTTLKNAPFFSKTFLILGGIAAFGICALTGSYLEKTPHRTLTVTPAISGQTTVTEPQVANDLAAINPVASVAPKAISCKEAKENLAYAQRGVELLEMGYMYDNIDGNKGIANYEYRQRQQEVKEAENKVSEVCYTHN
jgi:hypothetical protein